MTPVRFSHLKAIAQSPAHYRHRLSAESPSSAAQQLGTAVHAMLLGGAPVVPYDGVRRGKEYDAFASKHAGATILTANDHVKAMDMHDAVVSDSMARWLLDGAHKEHTFGWRIGDRECQGTPDAYSGDYVVDIKTCASSDPRRFLWDARKYHYASQLSWYANGLRTAGHANPKDAFIIAVESAPPHCVVVYRLTERMMDVAERTWRSWWERLMVCEASQSWPGYAQTVVDFDALDSEEALELDFGTEEGAE